jgi:hypothetical protein
VWGIALTLAVAAHAQESPGVVLTVPAPSYGEIKALNEGPLGLSVSLLHTTQGIFGSFRTQVATIAVRPRTTSPGASLVFRLPQASYALIGAMNPNAGLDTVGGSTGFVTVAAPQSEQLYVLSRARYLMLPLNQLFDLQQLNSGRQITLVYSAQLAIGNTPLPVALVALDQASATGVRIPQASWSLCVALNSNVKVVNPRAYVGGISVAIIDVNPLVPTP